MSVDPPHPDLESDDDLLRRAQEEKSVTESPSTGPPVPTPAEEPTETRRDAADAAPSGPPGQTTETLRDAPIRLPKRVGHYHIKRVLASGGMGTVYEAVQEKPRRVVAIKLMRQGIASRSALRRFEYESQILARLRHPGIAQVYEAGTHRDDTGTVPFFAMEYIPNAQSITKYAEDRKLSTRQKLELFAQVCDAVHHGHQKGIIHRDLKPGNILVDTHGQVKIIDFGVARGTDSDMAVTTLQTDIGQLVGTLQYMSPEQCLADPHDIDTRSDVYALGVVLYELLSCKLPYRVSSTRIYDGARVIREEQPTKLTTVDKTLKGDIETIVFKALEKDRERRYQSAVELAQDVNRYLSGEAIVARRPSIVYQLRVFARKNKALFGAIAAVFVVLVGGVIASTTLYIRAENEATKAHTTLEFLEGMYDPGEGSGGGTATLKTLLEAAERKIGSGVFAGQPEIEATVRHTIGRAYMTLDLFDGASPHLEAALAIRRRILGDEHLETLKARVSWAWLFGYQRKYRQAESHAREVFLIGSRTLGPEHPSTLEAANRLAYNLFHQGEYEEAEALMRPTLEIARRVLGPEHPDTLVTIYRLAAALGGQPNKRDEGVDMFRQLLAARRRTSGDAHKSTLWAMSHLGLLLTEQGVLDEAQSIHEQGLEIAGRSFGDKRRVTIHLLEGLGIIYRRQGRLDEAEQLCRRSSEASRELLGEMNGQTLDSLNCLVRALTAQGKLDEARPYFAEWIRHTRRAAEQPDANVNRLNEHAMLLLTCEPEDLCDPKAALTVAKRAVEMSGGQNALILDTLALAYFMTGDTAKAVEAQEKAVALLPPEESPRRTELEANLAKFRAGLAETQGDPEGTEAEPQEVP